MLYAVPVISAYSDSRILAIAIEVADGRHEVQANPRQCHRLDVPSQVNFHPPDALATPKTGIPTNENRASITLITTRRSVGSCRQQACPRGHS